MKMKVVNITNDNIVIQARNQDDYIKAMKVAEKMNEIEQAIVLDSINCIMG
jgi:hypothetical protein